MKARSALERLARLAALLRAGSPVSAPKVAREFEVHPKTIQRDMDYLRHRLGYVCEWSGGEHSYRLVHAPQPVL